MLQNMVRSAQRLQCETWDVGGRRVMGERQKGTARGRNSPCACTVDVWTVSVQTRAHVSQAALRMCMLGKWR